MMMRVQHLVLAVGLLSDCCRLMAAVAETPLLSTMTPNCTLSVLPQSRCKVSPKGKIATVAGTADPAAIDCEYLSNLATASAWLIPYKGPKWCKFPVKSVQGIVHPCVMSWNSDLAVFQKCAWYDHSVFM